MALAGSAAGYGRRPPIDILRRAHLHAKLESKEQIVLHSPACRVPRPTYRQPISHWRWPKVGASRGLRKPMGMGSGKRVLKTDYAGKIRINWDKVAQLKTDDPLLLRAQNLLVGYQARLVPATEPGKVATLPAGATSASSDELALADIQRIGRPHPLYTDWSFEGGVNMAMDVALCQNQL